MNICGQHFSAAIVAQIHESIRQNPSISRRALSRQVCEWLDWRSPNAQWQDMSCRKALSKMQKLGILALPRVEQSFSFQHSLPHPVAPVIPQLICSLADLGEIWVYPVSSRYAKESKIWAALLDCYHYLKSGPLCGAQIRYLVKCGRGYLGALSFSSATFALACRDRYIGWTEGARRANLERVVCNSRFLILPQVAVPNLASHILSLALARLSSDWQERYQTQLLLVETFVGPDFTGTCYKAANFTYIGESAGRRDGQPKQVLLYPLAKGWRQALCVEPEIQIPPPAPESPQNWAEEEFGAIRLYDERLKRRLYSIAQDFYNAPGSSIPEACGGSKAGMWATYRFMRNSKVTMDIILKAHREATIIRIKQEKVVLCPQDTTTLNYTTHPLTAGLGPISKGVNSLGLLLHDTLAFTEKGTPLGVLQGQCWARDPEQMDPRNPAEWSPEQKESAKWLKSFRQVSQIQKQCPETLLVSIGDREADIYELFREAARKEAPKLLVRAMKGRRRKVEEEYLWDYLARQEIAISHQIHVPHQGRRAERDSWLDIRFAKVILRPPQGHKTPLTVWAVYVVEYPRFVPAETEPIEWLLLTTQEVQSAGDATRIVEWYTRRWSIEVYHRVLKSGCRIEDRQLEAADRLETCLGIDMVVAWRIYHLTMLSREKPDLPCTVFFEEIEWKALYCWAKKTTNLPEKPPTILESVLMLASKGGYLGRKCDGFPGTKAIWHALVRFPTAVEMYALFTNQSYLNPFHSGP